MVPTEMQPTSKEKPGDQLLRDVGIDPNKFKYRSEFEATRAYLAKTSKSPAEAVAKTYEWLGKKLETDLTKAIMIHRQAMSDQVRHLVSPEKVQEAADNRLRIQGQFDSVRNAQKAAAREATAPKREGESPGQFTARLERSMEAEKLRAEIRALDEAAKREQMAGVPTQVARPKPKVKEELPEPVTKGFRLTALEEEYRKTVADSNWAQRDYYTNTPRAKPPTVRDIIGVAARLATGEKLKPEEMPVGTPELQGAINEIKKNILAQAGKAGKAVSRDEAAVALVKLNTSAEREQEESRIRYVATAEKPGKLPKQQKAAPTQVFTYELRITNSEKQVVAKAQLSSTRPLTNNDVRGFEDIRTTEAEKFFRDRGIAVAGPAGTAAALAENASLINTATIVPTNDAAKKAWRAHI